MIRVMPALAGACFTLLNIGCASTHSDPPLTGGWICCEQSNGCTSGPVADQDRALDACKAAGGKASKDPALHCVEQKCVK